MQTPILTHKHYIIRAEVPISSALQDISLIEQWMADLISAIDMKVLIPPRAKYCDKVNNRGVTAIAAIETSHMAIHVWDETAPAVFQFDLYSCRDFDTSVVLENIEKTFGLMDHASVVLNRDPLEIK